MEYDLQNLEHTFFVSISAEIGELKDRQQALKSITSEIERAKLNIPTAGKFPYSRIIVYKDSK